MSLQQLLGEVPIQKFVAEYLHRLPFSLPDAAESICHLGTWNTFGEVLQSDAPDLMVVRDGARSECDDPQSLVEAQQLSAEGHTILVRHAERHHAGLAELAAGFRRDLKAPVNIHMYITPAGAHGFGWHYDAEDVFIIQTGGAKQYSLRKNTVNPWPLVETIPQDMRYEREMMPVSQVDLHAGDWLYIPCGYWHKAEALGESEPAISLAVGVMSPSAILILDLLRERLVDSLMWRQRLPIAGEASPLNEDEQAAQFTELLSMLADDAAMTLRSAAFQRALQTRVEVICVD